MTKHTNGFQKALDAVVKIDPKLGPLAQKSEFPWFFESAELPSSFEYLVNSIASQQVSGHAAKAILQRVSDLDGGKFSPKNIAKTPIEDLRGAGLSMRKSEYIKGLAEAFNSGQLSEEGLRASTDSEIMDNLTAIRGVGPWTAQMYLLFYLHRMDVFSPLDIGVQRGFRLYEQKFTKHKINKDDELPPPLGTTRKSLQKANVPVDLKHMEHVAAKFSPYRTAFQLLLWKLTDQNLEVLDIKPKNQQHDPAKLPPTPPTTLNSPPEKSLAEEVTPPDKNSGNTPPAEGRQLRKRRKTS